MEVVYERAASPNFSANLDMLQVNNLGRRIERRRPPIEIATPRSVDSGWFVLGPEVTGFEGKFASYIGCEDGISAANGTGALRIDLLAGGIGPDGSVATAANAGMYCDGGRPCPARRAEAVMATHLYRHDMREFAATAAYCLGQTALLIEGCALSHAAQIVGRSRSLWTL